MIHNDKQKCLGQKTHILKQEVNTLIYSRYKCKKSYVEAIASRVLILLHVQAALKWIIDYTTIIKYLIVINARTYKQKTILFWFLQKCAVGVITWRSYMFAHYLKHHSFIKSFFKKILSILIMRGYRETLIDENRKND